MNLVIRQAASYAGNERWDWSVWIDGPDAVLDQVESVEWVLHPTFPDPVVLVTQRQSKFRLSQNGWGEFEINANVKAKDGRRQHLTHQLRLAESGGRPAQPASAEQSAAFSDNEQTPTDQGGQSAPTRRRIEIGGKSGIGSIDIFVSYRRKDSMYFTGWLRERLINNFGADQVFTDVDVLPPSAEFPTAIIGAVASCKVLLAIIGPKWLTATDELGRRIENANDFVRLEIEEALARSVPIFPILMDDTLMPRRQDLPASLAGLVERQAFIIRNESFPDDADRLVRALRRIIPDQ